MGEGRDESPTGSTSSLIVVKTLPFLREGVGFYRTLFFRTKDPLLLEGHGPLSVRIRPVTVLYREVSLKMSSP